ncbi:acyltransferase family protein [Pararhizobium antarcticum]|uniref:Acyltransferase n=1 Tax=Pararhizobium antarcticum TaxID=1798805 RepID=A0A657LQA7_9HYPH|nr:acyltransferase [Pararhizobium antarcticum]OJF95075.1 acyltransferase [Pararhizobium antarcticum]OJF98103.1 acyltransferase [Rhizobium sp. 58]
MKSFGAMLVIYGGFGPGFNFVRIALAFSIVFYHVLTNSGHWALAHGPVLWFLEYSLVPMFFALSGFLITGSAQRLSLENFLLNRALRIVPALAVDILVCAFIIGPAVTTLSLGDYFTDAGFYSYMLNIIGLVHFQLPGVFTDLPMPQVNGALWTIPWEINCYIVMSVLMLTRMVRRAEATVLLLAIFIVAGLAIEHFGPAETGDGIHVLFVGRGAQLITPFLCGVLAYQLRNRIPMTRLLFVVCLSIALAAMVLLDTNATESVASRLIVMPVLTYITIYAGLTRLPLPKIVEGGDYSYGVYLYHVPLIQLAILLGPPVLVGTALGIVVLTVLVSATVLCVAAGSWHLIEKPILSLRKRYSLAGRMIGHSGRSGLTSDQSGAKSKVEPQKAT